jgi:maltose O-acetyltransferase
MASELEKMLAGELYRPGDPELAAMRRAAQERMRAYNATIVGDPERPAARKALFGSVGDGTDIRAPVYVDYGVHIHIGRDSFMNFGVTLLDVCEIRIGDMTQIGPFCQILAADHSREAEVRDAGLENGKPVTIGRNVWIGGGVLILPGVTVGDDAIIGAGAVVTRDVPPGATVGGIPARVLPGH